MSLVYHGSILLYSALGAIYGSIYGIRYLQVSHIASHHMAEFKTCENNYLSLQQAAIQKKKIIPGPGPNGEFGTVIRDPAAEKAAEDAGPCQTPGTLTHGFLGFPTFSGDGYK